ncbi:hypothetical protein HME9302_02637 [Alteripontixanthobacter maritimus]|uniref:Type IV secretion system protein virB2 n=1 Tax=Alteripontixanthobacter maritimus TaxID=2161824 RepID=A0A369Q5W5_9SPHN|nr:TrbC/VirB2 family protein [Alteripontixanthobacter maritimus]RDC58905.1 hypothetical protein HME9302_00081 [Alteripontixanthobacter maritimus]RDC61415.1 hypothetical protein HME9302_02637 [Alteripontixanthobacter maritimus]
MTLPLRSLFEPAGQSSIGASVDWLTGTLLGSLAIGLCIIAVAVVGLTMLTGRLSLRDGARVVLGCFILLGAPIIANGFMKAGTDIGTAPSLPMDTMVAAPIRDLPPADYDPYAGASLRDDR